MPAYLGTDNAPDRRGAKVQVDYFAVSEGGGVTLEWCPARSLALAAMLVSGEAEPDMDALSKAASELAKIARTGNVPPSMRHVGNIAQYM
ncbi:hypothetical protein [Nocardia brasiliensis]|uniref:Uncharacterized protein n=1 Tax=Nocardia brasiliensis (strain ATCC 700358 / HUJEG-1) TaxID=1133849 RepID=K0F120_NOCB7|nr:hypothetical protein [Nocardia brasiliensis]AFU02780.1 hypothetical protein O3I_024125 [Nocardia brasiliensis ATCC 700358]